MYARVLGVAQDAGVPHPGCVCPRCERHRSNPLLPACLGLVGRESYLIDCTPAFGRQINELPRFPSAILLTHVHVGHVSGLLKLGPEICNAKRVLVHATPAVCAFLRENAPWELLVRKENIFPIAHAPGERFELEPGLIVEAIEVPHRNEYADTVAYLISGPKRTLLYLPDIDRWDDNLSALLARCDLALLDGTFYAADELERQWQVPHPPIADTLDRLSEAEARKVKFLHFNHTNPVLDAHGPAAPRAKQGESILLGELPPRPSDHATTFPDMD